MHGNDLMLREGNDHVLDGDRVDPLAGRRSFDGPSFAQLVSAFAIRAGTGLVTAGSAGFAAGFVDVGVASAEGDRPVEVGDGTREVPPGDIYVSTACQGLGVVGVQAKRCIEVDQRAVKVAQSPTGFRPGSMQLGVAGGKSTDEGHEVFLAGVERPIEVGNRGAEIAEGQERESAIQARLDLPRAELKRLVAVGDRTLVIAPRGM